MTTLKDIQDEVLFNTFDDGKYRAKAVRRINDAQREVARRTEWGWSQAFYAITDGQATLNGATPKPPAGWSIIQRVWAAPDATSGRVERELAFGGTFTTPASQPSDPGWPLDMVADDFYRVSRAPGGDQVLHVSTMVKAVRVDGYLNPQPLVNPADVCQLPDEAVDLLILWARAQLYLVEDDLEMNASLEQQFDRRVSRLNQSMRPPTGGPKVTPGTWGDGAFGG